MLYNTLLSYIKQLFVRHRQFYQTYVDFGIKNRDCRVRYFSLNRFFPEREKSASCSETNVSERDLKVHLAAFRRFNKLTPLSETVVIIIFRSSEFSNGTFVRSPAVVREYFEIENVAMKTKKK